MTFKDVKDEDILEFFAKLGYCPGKKYDVIITNKDEFACKVIIKGKGNFIYNCTLSHISLHALINFEWVQFLYMKYGEPYREAFLETIDDEMFFIQEKWT